MIIVYALYGYLIIGMLFALRFVNRWIEKLDESVAGAGWKFRLIIFPGCVLLWPLLLTKLRKQKSL
jgi:hypothetical protein